MNDKTILFVDDDVQYLRLLASIVAEGGFHTCQANSGAQALEMLGSHRCAMMVTDLQMPGMDGLELSRLAKKLDPDMEITLVSGAISPEVIEIAIGIAKVLSKPCRVEEILALVRGLSWWGRGGSTADG